KFSLLSSNFFHIFCGKRKENKIDSTGKKLSRSFFFFFTFVCFLILLSVLLLHLFVHHKRFGNYFCLVWFYFAGTVFANEIRFDSWLGLSGTNDSNLTKGISMDLNKSKRGGEVKSKLEGKEGNDSI
ncbi:hypothetical protein C5167_029973, partial [Papaver somniferum]